MFNSSTAQLFAYYWNVIQQQQQQQQQNNSINAIVDRPVDLSVKGTVLQLGFQSLASLLGNTGGTATTAQQPLINNNWPSLSLLNPALQADVQQTYIFPSKLLPKEAQEMVVDVSTIEAVPHASPVIVTSAPSPPSPLLSCNHCPNMFSSVRTLRQHERLCHADKLTSYAFVCRGCSQRFVTEHSLKVHASKSKPCRHYRLLPNEITTAAAAYDDQTMKTDDSSGSSSEKQATSTVDANSSCDQPTFACGYCSKIYLQPEYLRKHERRDHADLLKTAQRVVSCSVCSGQFVSTRSLNSHLRQSNSCAATFRQRLLDVPSAAADVGNKNKNNTTSSGSNNCYVVACRFCPSSFLTIGSLRKHERNFHRSQLSGFPVLCKWCAKPFVSHNALRTHLRFSPKCLQLQTNSSNNK